MTIGWARATRRRTSWGQGPTQLASRSRSEADVRFRVGGRAQGFTLIEIMVVVAIIGIAAGIAVPQLQHLMANQRLQGAVRSISDAFVLARSEAIRTGNTHIVFFGIPP